MTRPAEQLLALITDAQLDGNLRPQHPEQVDRLARAKALAWQLTHPEPATDRPPIDLAALGEEVADLGVHADDDDLGTRLIQIGAMIRHAGLHPQAAAATSLPVLTVLHVRGYDSGCNLTLWTEDGREYEGDWAEENVDAGAGHDAESWAERIADAETDPPSPYRDELLAVLNDPPVDTGSTADHIHGWDDLAEQLSAARARRAHTPGGRDDDYTPAAINRTTEQKD